MLAADPSPKTSPPPPPPPPRPALDRVTGVGVVAAAAVISLVAHGAFFGVISTHAFREAVRRPEPVKIKVVEKPAPEPPPEAPPPPPPEPAKPKKKPPPAKIASERQPPPQQPVEPVKPVQGLSESSFDKNGTAGFSAPMGNTLMTKDEGKRVDAPPPPMAADLSADPVLLRESLAVPEHTPEALDAGLEGKFYVDVYVDATGAVTQVEVRKRIGYGMDALLTKAARGARFIPRKNKLGAAEPAWSSILFNIRIP